MLSEYTELFCPVRGFASLKDIHVLLNVLISRLLHDAHGVTLA